MQVEVDVKCMHTNFGELASPVLETLHLFIFFLSSFSSPFPSPAPPDNTHSSNKRLLTLDDVFDPSLQTKSFHGSWVKGGGGESELLYLSSNGVILFSPATNNTRTLLDPEIISRYSNIL